MTVRAICANAEAAAYADDPLTAAVIVVTMNASDLARITAALGALCDHAPRANIRNDLIPILTALNEVEV